MATFPGSAGTTLTAQARALGGIVNQETLAAGKTLDGASANIQILDPDGSSRTITLAKAAYGTAIWLLYNAANAAGELLNIVDAAAVAITSLDAGEGAFIAYDGTTWRSVPLNVTDAGDKTIQADVIQESTAGAGVTADGVLHKDGKVDFNGVAGALILDADADTHIGASTDDQIDITVSGAIDFQITANTLTAVSGSTIATNTIAETTAAAGVTVDSLLIRDGGLVAAGAIDLNGLELILDADADTSLTADTDDQIDIRISGADDFQFTANTFTALSGSSIATDTIAETTAAAGVTVDGCLIKDGRAANLATAALFLSTEQTGTGAPQNVAHGFASVPTLVVAIPSDLTGGPYTVAYGAHDATNAILTVTTGEKFRVLAIR